MWPGTDSSLSPSMNKVGTAASGPRIGCSRHTGVTEGMLLAVHTARYKQQMHAFDNSYTAVPQSPMHFA